MHVVCVAKPDRSLGLCVDYRALNAITDTDSYPMPRMKELDNVAPAAFIMMMDWSEGYYQMPLKEAANLD